MIVSNSLMGDLLKVFKKHLGGKVAVAFAFTKDPGYKTVHWATNVSRENGINLLQETTKKMIAQSN